MRHIREVMSDRDNRWFMFGGVVFVAVGTLFSFLLGSDPGWAIFHPLLGAFIIVIAGIVSLERRTSRRRESDQA